MIMEVRCRQMFEVQRTQREGDTAGPFHYGDPISSLHFKFILTMQQSINYSSKC